MESTMETAEPSSNSTSHPSSISYELLDDSEYIPLLVLGSISSCLSLLGSSCVIHMSRRQLNKVMQRLVFALSLADMLSSTSSLLMPYLIPSYIGLPGAIGNHQSCAAFGFLFSLGVLMGSFYNAYLSIYYFLVVRRSWKERDFTAGLETGAHGLALLVALSGQIAAAATQSINPSPVANNLCVYASSPWGCNDHEELDCTRSSGFTVGTIAVVMTVVMSICTLLGFVCTFMVWTTVRATLKRSGRYRFQGDQNSAGDERLRQVAIQAVLYSLVYLNTIIWPVTAIFLSMSSSEALQARKLTPAYIVYQYLYWILYPLQGFLNFFVYTRQKVNRLRQLEPGRSFLWCYRQVLSADISRTSTIASTRTRSPRQ